jgi:glycosyltransferase involved in cell wall biosynthesis
MKILLIHNYYRYRGGEDRYVEILKDTLSRKGHQVKGFSCDSREIKTFNLIDRLLIPLKFIHSSTANRKLEKLLLEEKPDLAVIHNLFPLVSLSILKVLKRYRIPIVKRIDNYRFLCLNGLFLRNNSGICDVCKNGNFFHGIIHRCYQGSFLNSLGMAIPLMVTNWKKLLLSTVDLFLAPSQFVKEKFSEVGFPAEKIVVLPNFLDFEPAESLLEPESYAIFIGRLSEEKGLLTLLKVFKELPNLPLKIMGEGPLENGLKEFVRNNQMKNVAFTGFVDGNVKKKILSRAQILIFPSECFESFGYSIIESHACGVPVIASAIGGAKELIVEGENGFLFEPGNPDDLREKIFTILAMDKKDLMEMKKNSLNRVKELYTKEIGYKNLLELFKRLQGVRGREVER